MKITKPESWLLLVIEKYISPFDNVLRKDGRPNGRTLNTQDLVELLKDRYPKRATYHNIRKLITGLKEKGIIDEIRLETKEKGIVINPDIIECGNELTDSVYAHFKTKRAKRNFVKAFPYDGPVLSNGECWLFIHIRKYVSYTDNALRVGGHKNGKLLNIKDLAKLVNESYDNTRKLVAGLKKKHVIAEYRSKETQENVITVNPRYVMKGQNVLKETIAHFEPCQV